MSYDVRGRRTRYDNIAAGSATGRERTIANTTVSPAEAYGGGQGASDVSENEQWMTAIARSVSTSNFGPENMTAGQNPVEEPGVTAGVS